MSAAATNTSCGSDCEVRTLIAIWGEDRIQELDRAVKNQAIFDKNIAKKICQKGYDRLATM